MDLQREDSGRIAWLAGWGLAAVILCVTTGAAALSQDFAEPDNAMRLVRVRDMLGGQGWFDNVQHRLNPPEGTPMHWAQWIDALLAAPIFLLTPLMGQQAAEIVMAFVWPLGLLGAFMFLVVRISGEMGARDGLRRQAEWAGAIVAALAFPTIDKFAPGAFDHHNVELVLGLAAVLGLIRMREQPVGGLVAGAALGLAMATAAEGAPLAVAGLGLAGLLWLLQPTAYAAALQRFGVGFAGASAIMFALLVSPADWFAPVCDAMGAPFLGFGLIGGGVAIALAHLPPAANQTLLRRLAASALLSGAGLFALIRLFPECLGGGYGALGREMSELWMVQISETRSLGDLLADDPAMILSVAGAAFAGLVAAGFYLRTRWRQPGGWIVLSFLLVGWAILAWQIRGTIFATAFAIPFGAWAIAAAHRSRALKPSAIGSLGFIAVLTSMSAAAWATADSFLQARLTNPETLANYRARVASSGACDDPASLRALRAAPTGIMLNHFDLGAGVLVWTDHSVLAGPYHRDIDGTMTMIHALRSGPDQAHAIVTASSADYVLICRYAPETAFYASRTNGVAPDQTLSAMLGRNDHPDWLKPVDIGQSPLSLYRIVR